MARETDAAVRAAGRLIPRRAVAMAQANVNCGWVRERGCRPLRGKNVESDAVVPLRFYVVPPDEE
jgi:hypothetical protein